MSSRWKRWIRQNHNGLINPVVKIYFRMEGNIERSENQLKVSQPVPQKGQVSEKDLSTDLKTLEEI